ncbi:MAG: NAD(P)-dependent oxidoreductase [Saprospiraceae bacterium]
MSDKLRIGIIREGKVPPDSRVAFPPQIAAQAAQHEDIDLKVQPSEGRCFPDSAYEALGVTVNEDLSDCDVLIGVKEVPIPLLVANKTCFFFSHTHKEQAYNRDLLRAVLDKNIRLIDYELLTDDDGKRLIAFGRFAGMVGAHHAMRAWGIRTGNFDLPQMNSFEDYEAAKSAYAKTSFGDVRVVSTGAGRVGNGSVEVLRDAGFTELSHEDFLAGKGAGAVFTQVGAERYVQRKDGKPFVKRDFYDNPTDFESAFLPFSEVADVMVHGIFWDNKAPAMCTVADMAKPSFNIKVIADVTCDIAPLTSMPATLKASTIADPYFGFDPKTGEEVNAWGKDIITMMTVDNLPNELPRDASNSFGSTYAKVILPELLKEQSDILDRASITNDGKLTDRYRYLQRFVDGK